MKKGRKPKIHTEPVDSPIKGGEIKAWLKTSGIVYEAEGNTIEEVINNLIVPKTVSYGILVLTKGDVKQEKVLQPRIMMRLFNPGSEVMKSIVRKQVSMMFAL